MVTRTDLGAGTELAGYRIERVLGRGGMSVVYLAEDLRLKRRVALKLMAPELAQDTGFRERFLAESEVAASLDHPNVVPIYQAGEAHEGLFIAMRYVEGADLKAKLATGVLPPEETVGLVAQIAEALDASHARGLVHRDVKPSNALIAPGTGPGGSDHVYLADFGLTRRTVEGHATVDANLIGTIDYVAPEQIEGEEVGSSADLYSLGCLLYECLTGETPFPNRSDVAVLFAHLDQEPPKVSSRRPELGEAIDAVIAKSLAKAPEERFQSGRELVEAARKALGIAEPARLRPWRLPVLLALAGIAVIAVGSTTYLLVGRGTVAPPTGGSPVDSVQRIDQASNRLSVRIGLDGEPVGVAAGDGAVWVATYQHKSQTQGIARIDPGTNAVTRTYDANVGFATGIAVGERAAWTIYNRRGPNPHAQITPIEPTVSGLDSIQRLDPRRGSFSTAATYRYGFESVAAGEGAVWALTSAGVVFRIDPKSGRIAKIPLPSTFPAHTALIAVGEGAVWVLHGPPGCKPPLQWGLAPDCRGVLLTRIDPATNHTVRTVTIPFEPAGLAVGDGAVWLSSGADDSVLRLDPATGRVTRRIAVGRNPVGIAVGPRAVWVANSADGTVSRIDPRTGKVTATITVAGRPLQIVVDADSAWVAVAAQY